MLSTNFNKYVFILFKLANQWQKQNKNKQKQLYHYIKYLFENDFLRKQCILKLTFLVSHDEVIKALFVNKLQLICQNNMPKQHNKKIFMFYFFSLFYILRKQNFTNLAKF